MIMLWRRRTIMISIFKNRKRTIYDRDGKIPYLVRYYIFLKDRSWFPFNITLHKILVSDEPTLHDHPWSWGTLIIKGGYWEHIPVRSQEGYVVGSTKKWWGPGTIRFRKADDLHWLELEKDENGKEIPCWSLFYMGKKSKEWGFMRHVYNQGFRWIHHEAYLKDKKQDDYT